MRKTSHKYKHGRRLKNKFVWIISLTILACALLANYGNSKEDTPTPSAQSFFFKADVDVEEIKNNALITDCEKAGGSYVENECTYSKAQMEAKVKEYFPRSWREIMVIVQAEGGWSMEKKNYNCYYAGKWEAYKRADGNIGRRPVVTDWTPVSKQTKGIISTSCAKKDRHMAWSVDCFLLQKNYVGRKQCPTDVTIDEHLLEIADMTRKYDLDKVFSSVWTNNHLTYK